MGWLGCSGSQSALAPAGREAEKLHELFLWMTAGGAVIYLGMVALTIYSVRTLTPSHNRRRIQLMIIGGGVVVPTAVLAALLTYGLSMLPDLIAPAPPGSLTISVTGHQYWWRFQYLLPNREPIEVANEIRLPVGEPVQFRLESSDVIHSFWIPSLAGKRDLIPGRITTLALTPTKTGYFRGVCAEYCGTSHALMTFDVQVVEKPEFANWLDQQARPFASPSTVIASSGRKLFLSNGCSACHTVRGTPARGRIAPDLTHVGSRHRIAGNWSNEPEGFQRWIKDARDIKPDVHMPEFKMLPEEDIEALAAYLEELK